MHAPYGHTPTPHHAAHCSGGWLVLCLPLTHCCSHCYSVPDSTPHTSAPPMDGMAKFLTQCNISDKALTPHSPPATCLQAEVAASRRPAQHRPQGGGRRAPPAAPAASSGTPTAPSAAATLHPWCWSNLSELSPLFSTQQLAARGWYFQIFLALSATQYACGPLGCSLCLDSPSASCSTWPH